MSVQLLVVRHTAVVRPEGCCVGRSDLPLAPSYSTEYLRVCTAVRRLLAGRIPFRILTSPLSRCSQLALDLSKDPGLSLAFHGRSPERDGRLLEFNYGSWEGEKWDDIDAERLNYWMEHWTVTRAGEALGAVAGGADGGAAITGTGDGESLQDMLTRVADLCSELALGAEDAFSAQKDATVVLITHAGVVRCLYHLVHGVPPADAFSQDIEYGSVTEFVLPLNLARHNQTKE